MQGFNPIFPKAQGGEAKGLFQLEIFITEAYVIGFIINIYLKLGNFLGYKGKALIFSYL